MTRRERELVATRWIITGGCLFLTFNATSSGEMLGVYVITLLVLVASTIKDGT